MDKMRPPGVTELLLTNDGDHILEGSVTNFFVVCEKVSPTHIVTFSINETL
jgi:branched-subunit amino acid aminotransferase/4-amino-4-deoxychorismate lyase